MKINELTIEQIGGIEHLNLIFNDGFNLICGTNGIGKTTILECIAQFFSRSNSELVRKKAGNNDGKLKMILTVDGTTRSKDIKKENFHPNERNRAISAFGDYSSHLLSLKTHRDIKYTDVSSIVSDPPQEKQHLWKQSIDGVKSNDIKQWFVGRYMWSAHEDALSEEQLSNLDLAKRCFSLMDPSIEFSKVFPATNDIMVTTQDEDIYFEYLSSGFKSCLYILLGIIKQIEYRFKEPFIKVDDFPGVILIDEIDLHLHPIWQGKLASVMKNVFKNAQIIATSHSPHMIQTASPNEIITLASNSQGKVTQKALPQLEYGFQGWTIEEILTDIMGLEDTRSDSYKDALEKFETALDAEDEELLKSQYDILDKMLHPNNPMRKILRMQMAMVVQEID